MALNQLREYLNSIEKARTEFTFDNSAFEKRVHAVFDEMDRLRDELQTRAADLDRRHQQCRARAASETSKLRSELSNTEQERNELQHQLNESFGELSLQLAEARQQLAEARADVLRLEHQSDDRGTSDDTRKRIAEIEAEKLRLRAEVEQLRRHKDKLEQKLHEQDNILDTASLTADSNHDDAAESDPVVRELIEQFTELNHSATE